MVAPLRILLTVPSVAPDFGGPVTKALGLAAALRQLGHHVTVLGAGDGSSADVVALPAIARFHGTPVSLALHRIVGHVRRSDVVHVIGFRDPVGTIAALVARVARIPTVLEPAGMHRRRLRSLRLKAAFDATLGRLVVASAQRIIATSALEARELREDGVAATRVVVRPNGIVPPPRRPRGTFRHQLGLDVHTPLVLALGRVHGKKGLVPLLEAVARMAGVHLAVVGPDAGDGTLEEIEAARRRLGVLERVHLVPRMVEGQERADAFADADVFCLWSLNENFGLAAGEAAACGTPVLVSDQCGVAEWLGAGVAMAPAAELDTRLQVLLNDPLARARLGDAGRAAALALSWTRVARQQAEVYASVA